MNPAVLMKRLCVYLGILLLFPAWTYAATEVFPVSFIPLQEAKAAVQTQLSSQGQVVAMPSQRQLVVLDDAEAIERVRRLLSLIDVMTAQFSVVVEISGSRMNRERGVGAEGVLPGGWARIQLYDSRQESTRSQSYSLRIQGGKSGQIEVGQIVPVQQSVRAWLTGLGVIVEQQQALMPVTGGFDVHIQAAGDHHARVLIHPWLKQFKQQRGGAGIQVDVAEAATELTIPLGQTVVLGSASGDAKRLAMALFSAGASNGEKQLLFRLRVDVIH